MTPTALPGIALLRRYHDDPACFADCYSTEITRDIDFATYVTAFYTTPLFKLERSILRLILRRPSDDADAGRLATGESDSFAAWTVEARAADQLLLRDLAGSTRSWLMTTAGETPGTTRLWFGSAVVPRHRSTGLGLPFRLLLGFHKLYSRALLASARRRLLT